MHLWRLASVTAVPALTIIWSAAARSSREGEGEIRSLGLLVGRTRALILGLLGEPRTTEDVAQALALAPSTASEQLTSLVKIGIVSRQRQGRHVYYELNEQGRELVRVFGASATSSRGRSACGSSRL